MNLVAQARLELWLRQAFAESGMSDPGGFAVKNTLQSASEVLVRLPLIALILSLLGALAYVLIGKLSRAVAFASLSFALFMCFGGISALWYADGLQRTARPPFVIGGLLTISVALSAAHPIWSRLHHRFTG
jgi:hypothetical protein